MCVSTCKYVDGNGRVLGVRVTPKLGMRGVGAQHTCLPMWDPSCLGSRGTGVTQLMRLLPPVKEVPGHLPHHPSGCLIPGSWQGSRTRTSPVLAQRHTQLTTPMPVRTALAGRSWRACGRAGRRPESSSQMNSMIGQVEDTQASPEPFLNI